MTPPLFLVEALPGGDLAVLDGAEGRHAAQVLRLRPDEALLLGDGRGGVCECTVAESRRDTLLVRIDRRRAVPEPRPRLVVAQALAKGDRGELAVELMTELGVDRIVPWQASRCVTRWSGERGERARRKWASSARAAAKQSRRAWVPVVGEPVTTRSLVALAARSPGLVLDETAEEALAAVRLPDAEEILLVVGPEGGIDDQELAALSEAGAARVRLGPEVLRTSTAGAAALAALSLRLGRWG